MTSDGFNFDEFNSLRSFSARDKYASNHLKTLGYGSSRKAFLIEGKDGPAVLKLAVNRKGVAQNR